MATETSGSWTAYPSLLTSLTDEQQILLEKAASAHYCGRYQEADAIFASELASSHTIPIVALQHADMLTASGRERERIAIIHAARASLDPDIEDLQSLTLLFELMLAEAEFFALGRLPDLSDLLMRVRSLFWVGNAEGLSDLQIRVIAAYYQFTDVLKTDTNMLKKVDDKVFQEVVADTYFASRLDELLAIYRALKAERRWRHAPLLIAMLLKYSPQGPNRQWAVNEAANLRETLSAADHPGIRFRSVSLRILLADLLPRQMANSLRVETVEILTQLAIPGFTSWEVFCPLVASMSAQREVTEAATRPDDLITSLTQLAEASEGRHDFLAANNLYRAARDTNHAWLNGIAEDDASRPAVLESLRRLQEAYIVFNDTRAHSSYYNASGVADLAGNLSARFRDYSAVISLVDRFEASHPDFANPRILERIYDTASSAAEALGQNDKLVHYAEKYQHWEARCPFSDATGNFADKTVLDPEHAMRWIGRGRNMITWGNDAVQLMLRWAAYEWEEGLLSTDDVKALFDPGLTAIPLEDVSTYLRDANYVDVAKRLLGTSEDPVDSTQFLDSYQRLLAWAQTPDRRPSLATRLYAVKVFTQSRIRRFGDYLQKYSPNGVTDENKAIYEVDRSKKLDVEQLEAQATATVGNTFVDSTRAAREAVHTLLVKCYQPKAKAREDISEDDFEARMEDAQKLIMIFERRGDLLRQYDAIVVLLRLLWQRHLLYETLPEAVLEPAEQAEAVFCRVRDLIVSRDASDNLVARAKLPANFPYNEHYRFALVGSFFAYKRCQNSSETELNEGAQHDKQRFMGEFLSWTLRSKGRGFVDVLSMEADVAKSIEEATAQLPTKKRLPVQVQPGGEGSSPKTNTSATIAEVQTTLEDLTLNSGTSLFRGATVTAAQVTEMLSAMPDGVVVVDYVDLPYSPEQAKRFAILHRRGKQPTLAPIMPVQVPGQVIGWVERNVINSEKPLDRPGGKDRLAFLSGLVDFVEKEEFQIKEGETLVLCPTGILNRVPLHAVPVGGRPLIERNPVVYCQSLSILYWIWKKSTGERTFPEITSLKATVINPMPTNWPSKDGSAVGDPVMSTPDVRRLALQVGASYQGSYPVGREPALDAISGSNIIHYHGHVCYNPNSALDSIMSLGAASLASPFSQRTHQESISARALFATRLAEPALATIIGCGSGVTAVSGTDDVLGLPTALFFAGAGAVVSTLWSIDDVDGGAFATAFYAALERRRARAVELERDAGSEALRAGSGSGDGPLTGMVDLAATMREAILALRNRTEELEAPYHWAAFTLSGFHLIPHRSIPRGQEVKEGGLPGAIATLGVGQNDAHC